MSLTGCNAILGFEPGQHSTADAGQGGGQAGSAATGGSLGGAGGMAGAGGSAGAGAMPTVLWSHSFGSAAEDDAWSVAAEPDGTVVVTGGFQGTVDFGAGPVPSLGDKDIFLLKLDAAGNHVFSLAFGSDDTDIGRGVAIDPGSNVILHAMVRGDVDFGGGALINRGYEDAALVKLDKDGNHQWSKIFGDAGSDMARDVAVDASSRVFAVGFFGTSINFGLGELTSNGESDGFAAGFDPNDNPLFSLSFGSSAQDRCERVALDSSRQAVVVGPFHETMSIGSSLLASHGDKDAFVAKLEPDGSDAAWAQPLGGQTTDAALGVGIDSNDNVIIAGTFTGTANFGGDDVESAGSTDIYVVKLTATGDHLWTKRFGGEGAQQPWDLTVDSLDRIAIVGETRGTVDFGAGPRPSAGEEDAFVLVLTPEGEHVHSAVFGHTLQDRAVTVAADAAGSIFIAGFFRQAIELGQTLISNGDSDIFVARLGP